VQFWVNVLTIAIPAAATLLAIWLKEWHLTRRERAALMKLLFTDLSNQLDITPGIVQTHAKIPERLKHDGFCIFFAQMSEWYPSSASRLAQLDPGNAFVYLAFAAHCKSVQASAESLQMLLHDAIGAEEPKKTLLVKAVEKNANGLNQTYLGYADACHSVLKAIASRMKRLPTEPIAKGFERIAQARAFVSQREA